MYDVLIVGGGPAGLAAALALGRACKRVLLCDAGIRRNYAADRLHNFVTRGGTPVEEFRGVSREQLEAYPNVEVRNELVQCATGSRGAFEAVLASGNVEARRLLLCTGVVDQRLSLDGFSELWGRDIVGCPYCHGWEARDRTSNRPFCSCTACPSMTKASAA